MRRLGLNLAWSCALALIVSGIARSDEPRQKECRTDLTIYIDLSGTVTASRHGQPAPLATLAEMLSRLLAQDERFAPNGDRVHIIALGAEAKPLLDVEGLDQQSRDNLRATLADFTTPDWKKSAAVKNIDDLGEFAKRTNFQSLVDDVADRVIGSSSGRRQIFIVASDFADDPDDDCDTKNRTAHLQRALSGFVRREGIREAFAPEADHQPYAQMILLATRPASRCEGLDAKLSRDLLDGLSPLHPHLVKDFDEKDAVQLATDIRERSAAVIRVGHVGANGSRLTFKIFNPTCSDVTIDRVILSRTDGGPTSAGYPIPLRNPVTVTTEKRESDLVEVDHPQVKTWRNATLTLQPLAIGVKSVPVEFWNGDSISIDRASPKLLPQIGSEGKLVMVVDMTVNSENDQKYRFTLPDVPKRSDGHKNENSRDLDVVASGDEPAHRHVALVYDVSNQELEKLRQRTTLVLKPESLKDGKVTGDEVRSDGTQPTGQPHYHGLSLWAPAVVLMVVVLGILVNLLLRIFNRGDSFKQAFNTSVNLGNVVSFAIAVIILKPWNSLELFKNKPVYCAAIALGIATWFLCLFGVRTAILTMWEMIFRNTHGDEERRRRDALARLLFWASPVAGFIVFWAIVHYIAGLAPIVTGGPQ